MRSSSSLIFGSITLVIAALLPVACGGGGSNNGSGGSTNTSDGGGGSGAGTHTTGTGNGGGLLFDGGTDPAVSMTISPADQTLTVLNGAITPAAYTVTGQTMNGAQANVEGGQWSFDRPDVAAINAATGLLTPTGLTGGQGTITYKLGNLSATTTVSVKLHYTYDPQNIDPSIKAQLGQASTPDSSMALLYPYDKTVFPRGLTGPTIQWNGGGPADIYYIHAVSPTFEFETWTTVAPPARYDFPTMPNDIWKKLTDSTVGDITFSIQRHDGAQPYLPVTHTWKIAPANLTGTIYFWEVNNGNVVRLKPGDTQPEDFLQKPAGVTCVACHSVSKNGSTLVASFNGGQSPWGTFDTATGSSIVNSGQNSGFQAISPDGQFVLTGTWINDSFGSSGFLSLRKSNDPNGMEITTLNPQMGAPAHPAWSGDGKKVAFTVRTDGNGLDFNTSTLWTSDFDAATLSFSSTHEIVTNDPSRTTVTFPTFSPDSKWIAFEKATQARSRDGQSDIWLVQSDGSNAVALDQANGVGVLTGLEVSSNYEPTFMPVAAGGYFWLVVVSERKYGNILTETNRSPYKPDVANPNQRTKQLWVTAIDANPLPGQDPSHPAFWLPGQELNNNNMRGEWALSPCKMLGDSCTAGYDCCNGFCRDDGTGNLTCSMQSGGCSQLGESCTSAANCCDPTASCIAGFCAKDGPG